MANEAIDMIRQAEAWAEETSAGAAAKRGAEEKAANERERQIVEEARARAQAEAKESAEEAGRKADAVVSDGVLAARGEAKKMIAAADGNMNAAVNEIVRGIFEKWQ